MPAGRGQSAFEPAAGTKWPALVVEEVDEIELYLGRSGRYRTISHLPTTVLTVNANSGLSSFDWDYTHRIFDREYSYNTFNWDCSHSKKTFRNSDPKIAVLSWRWDGEISNANPAIGSRNIYLALSYAKKVGIKYLFIDIVSINQKLQRDELIKQVVAFADLYRSTPVICAYNDSGHIVFTMRRPWIQSEMQHIASNNIGVTYVGCNLNQLGKWDATGYDPYVEQSYSDPEHFHNVEYFFPYELSRANRQGFLHTIFMVLCGKTSMLEVSDLKFIMPRLAPVLCVAHEKMSREDYLMTAALLSQDLVEGCGSALGFTLETIEGLYETDFRRYILENERRPRNRAIYLDGYKIADLGNGFRKRFCYVKLSSGADRHIFTVLGMPHSAFEDYLEGKRNRLADPPRPTMRPIQKVKIVNMKKDSWCTVDLRNNDGFWQRIRDTQTTAGATVLDHRFLNREPIVDYDGTC